MRFHETNWWSITVEWVFLKTSYLALRKKCLASIWICCEKLRAWVKYELLSVLTFTLDVATLPCFIIKILCLLICILLTGDLICRASNVHVIAVDCMCSPLWCSGLYAQSTVIMMLVVMLNWGCCFGCVNILIQGGRHLFRRLGAKALDGARPPGRKQSPHLPSLLPLLLFHCSSSYKCAVALLLT